MDRHLAPELEGWWRIIETSQWTSSGLDDIGPALLSLTGFDDRLRMHCLLAELEVRPTKTGASFTWTGAWAYNPMSGTGTVKLGRDGKLRGRIAIALGDESRFVAVRTDAPDEAIPRPPSYRDKWGRGRGRGW